MRSFQIIVAPHDFSEYAEAALTVALDLSRSLGAQLYLLHVFQPPAYAYGSELYAGGPIQSLLSDHVALRRKTEQRLSGIAARYSEPRHPIRTLLVEGTAVAESIDAEATRLGADLIVLGTHGRTGLAHLLLGSVAEATLRHAPCPVLTVPPQRRRVVETLGTHASRESAPRAL